jgi:hypothetical protein
MRVWIILRHSTDGCTFQAYNIIAVFGDKMAAELHQIDLETAEPPTDYYWYETQEWVVQ